MAKKDEEHLASLIREKRELLLQQLSDQRHVLMQMEQDILKIERCEAIMQSNYPVKTVSFAPKTIFSIRKKMGMKDFSEAFGELFASLGRQGLRPAGPCLSVYHDEDFNQECTDIEVGVLVSAQPGVKVQALDPGLCCFATHIGPYDDFTPCYTALAEWMEREGYSVSGPPFELYVKGYEDNVPPTEFVTEIYFPIRK